MAEASGGNTCAARLRIVDVTQTDGSPATTPSSVSSLSSGHVATFRLRGCNLAPHADFPARPPREACMIDNTSSRGVNFILPSARNHKSFAGPK